MVTRKTRYELNEDYERQKVFFEDENGDWVGDDYQNQKWALVEEQKKEFEEYEAFFDDKGMYISYKNWNNLKKKLFGK